MLVIDTRDGLQPGESQSQRRLQASIQATSPFAPKSWICSQCRESNRVDDANCRCCHRKAKGDVTTLDHRGRHVTSLRFPVSWVCSTCYLIHSVLDILVREATCTCREPTLQAVYDQFGDLFLFWPGDPTIQDLKDPSSTEEAARRLWEAGGYRWLDEMPKITLEEAEKDAEEDVPMM